MTGENGASSGDLITRQQPAASAGAPPMPQKPSGPFHVTISPTTPTGSGTVKSMPVERVRLHALAGELVGPAGVVAEPLRHIGADELGVDVAALERGDRPDLGPVLAR